MRSKNGTSKFLFVFIVFLGASFSAVDGATSSPDTTEVAITEAGTNSATDATGTSVATGDTSTQATGESSASAGGTEQAQESATAVTSNPVNDSQSTQEQTSPGTGPSVSADSQEQTTGGAGISGSADSQEQTTAGAGPSVSADSQEQTTGGAGPSGSSASQEQITAEKTTGTGKAGTAPDGTTNSASLEVTTTGEAVLTSVEEHRTEATIKDRGNVSEDRAGSTGQTTEEPKETSMTSSDSTKATATEADSLNETSIENTKTAQSRQPDHLIGMAIASVPVAAAVLVLAGIGLASISHNLFSKPSATSPNKERIMLESGGPGEPDGASNPIPDAQIVGDEGPVPVGAPAAPNGGGQPISNPAGDVENTKL